MAIAHNLGFPRIGLQREMKKAVEAYWRGEIDQSELRQVGQQLRATHWKLQAAAGLDYIPVGDFAWYDHVLNTSTLFGIIPERFQQQSATVDLDTMFCMARGQAPNGLEAPACEMTKWFDTNYHYIVPEFTKQQTFKITVETFFEEVQEALQAGYQVKPVLLGPLSLLWLGKTKGEDFDKLTLLDQLLPVYEEVFKRLAKLGIDWIQIDEPILVLDLPQAWQQAFQHAYQQLKFSGINCLLANYFGCLGDHLQWVCQLPVAGLHIDAVRAATEIDAVIAALPDDKILSVGIIDGRNIWRADLNRCLAQLEALQQQLGERLWVAPSCSLLHCPINLEIETTLDAELKSWLAFAQQKVTEITILCQGLNHGGDAIADQLAENEHAITTRQQSTKIHNPEVKQRVQGMTAAFTARANTYPARAKVQRQALNLPLLPTTTIGSFPQTKEIRSIRRDFKKGHINQETYEQYIRQEIATVIEAQEQLGLDVLVHGEAERNDMVEYFGELLEGVAFTANGWVQSYGSRCVKPPIIYGDINRPAPMTVSWSQYAQSLTSKPVKGMLTGPVTILAWSFVRDDQPRSQTALQLALALRDEVADLEAAGINIIQVDEPAFRESLPLRESDWQAYFKWAVQCFKVATSCVDDATQIHTHMCYSEFNHIITAIAALDADVITIESSRSDMELLSAFEVFAYPNEIGPGVYDIHSPLVPSTEEIEALLVKALQTIPSRRLWVNPDCGLKTRGWTEVNLALTNMVNAAQHLRGKLENNES